MLCERQRDISIFKLIICSFFRCFWWKKCAVSKKAQLFSLKSISQEALIYINEYLTLAYSHKAFKGSLLITHAALSWEGYLKNSFKALRCACRGRICLKKGYLKALNVQNEFCAYTSILMYNINKLCWGTVWGLHFLLKKFFSWSRVENIILSMIVDCWKYDSKHDR